MKGYCGKILNVNLTNGVIEEEIISDSIYENYLGGIGLAVSLLYDRIPQNADPLGPDNILAFVPGLLTGTGALMAGRFLAAAKSPLTGTWGEANCGGSMAAAIKQCGYDGVLFQGISPEPVYLYVEHGRYELRDAAQVWGKDAVETEEYLMKEASIKKVPRVACIGQAGENLSLISGIMNDKGRMAGRSGLGAVMGSKKLKAVVFAGAGKIPCFDREAVNELSLECYKKNIQKNSMPQIPGAAFKLMGRKQAKAKVLKTMDGYATVSSNKRYGTIISNELSIESGDAPVKNWDGTKLDFKYSGNINPNKILKQAKSDYHCYACAIGCGHICEVNNSQFRETHKPEYETVIGFSSLLLNGDLDAIFHLNEYLNRSAIDSISTAGTVAFALECYENGIITKADTGGLELSWGNTEAIIKLVEMIVKREGIGDILADGTKVAVQKIGKGSEKFAVHAGGQEQAMHDPKWDPGLGLSYSVEPTPGRHTIGSYLNYELYNIGSVVKGYPQLPSSYPAEEKYQASKNNVMQIVGCSLITQIINSCGICMFAPMMGINRYPIFQYINASTGWNKTPEEYMEIGQRIQTLKQLFNVNHGIDPKTLKIGPRAIGVPPQTKGPNKGKTFDLDKMMEIYWDEIGWNKESGIPTKALIEALGLENRIALSKMEG